ncbi:MAG TPA: methyltransferase domain-containing protein [Thermoanaerobaculia bacterium]|nr:methyltransferase domain-containing protein [Thermoanaerobaculia bacterium]
MPDGEVGALAGLAAARPVEFFKGFLRHPRQVGSVIPSSRFLIRQLLAAGEVDQCRVVVELGPGTGVVTKAMLRAMRGDGRLVALEINPRFIRLLAREIGDSRILLHHGPARDLEAALAEIGTSTADLVISGIPFSTMGRREAIATLAAVRRSLAPGGRFVAYQFRSHVRDFAEPIFGPARVESAVLNIPPMRVFTWRNSARFSAEAP